MGETKVFPEGSVLPFFLDGYLPLKRASAGVRHLGTGRPDDGPLCGARASRNGSWSIGFEFPTGKPTEWEVRICSPCYQAAVRRGAEAERANQPAPSTERSET